MSWLEILHLRSNEEQNRNLIEDLSEQCWNVEFDGDAQSVRIFRHQSVKTDLSLVIESERNSTSEPPTELGLRLKSALKEYGRVDHSVWLEIEGPMQETDR